MLTQAKLRKFVRARNRSEFQSNLQFQIDADACGFKVTDLGDAQPFLIDGFKGYQWKPVVKEISGRHSLPVDHTVRLIEFGCRLYIGGDDDEDTQRMLELMNKAEFIKPEV